MRLRQGRAGTSSVELVPRWGLPGDRHLHAVNGRPDS
jgi:hypothetical protein